MKRRFVPILAAAALSGCGGLPFSGESGNVYDLQREALLAYDNDENGRAEKLLQALSRTSPNDPLTLFYLGNLYARTGRPDQAMDAYQKSVMINGTDPRPWHNMAVIRLRQARAAFIQAHGLLKPDDRLNGQVEAILAAMEKIPLDAMRENPAGQAKP